MARPAKLTPTSRLSLEMSEETRRKLEQLRKDMNADSLAEVIRRSLEVYATLWHQQAEGKQVLIRGPKGDMAVLLT
jgi:hypothetical protein